jgi:signal transduction histidine kinase
MCQAITELTTKKKSLVTTTEFHDLNQCLDVAIAGAVTEFQNIRNKQESNRETEHLGSLAHEMRNAMTSVSISFQLIRRGTVGAMGSTGDVIINNMKRLEGLIDRSLTEVRLRVDPVIHVDSFPLTQLIDQILVSASTEAQARHQNIKILVDPTLIIEADQQAFYSALSNLIQNAIKYSHTGSEIEIRGKIQGDEIAIEVEDQCGGLFGNEAADLFKPFVQKNENRTGLGLGLTIAKKAIEELNHGKIEARTVDKTGCIFTIRLPRHHKKKRLEPAA